MESEELSFDVIVDVLSILPIDSIIKLFLTCKEIYSWIHCESIWMDIHKNLYSQQKFQSDTGWTENVFLLKQRTYGMNGMELLTFAVTHDLEQLMQTQLSTLRAAITARVKRNLIQLAKQYNSSHCLLLLAPATTAVNATLGSAAHATQDTNKNDKRN